MANQQCTPSQPKHELELKTYQIPYTCDGCQEIGFGPRYRCGQCDFDLHIACMFPQTSSIFHQFYPRSSFKFYKTPPKYNRRICDACTKPINGFIYQCEKDDLDLHPCCLNLKINFQIEDVEFNLYNQMQGTCMWCNKKTIKTHGPDNGWSYMSECGEYHVHVACVTQMALEEWINAHNANQDQQLALEKVNLKAIQAPRRGDCGKRIWKILKLLIKTVVSVVYGDPTTVLASIFYDLIS